MRFPRQDQQEIEALLERATAPAADANALLSELMELHERGEIQFYQGEVSHSLVREAGEWRIVQHWGHEVTVRFEAEVSPELPWEFRPLETEIVVSPGELTRVGYLATNLSDQPIVGLAVHEVDPLEARRFFRTVQCFCFEEQVLAPGETREMVLLFQVDTAAPQDLELIETYYKFYSAETYPG